jgi:hypothetical protein
MRLPWGLLPYWARTQAACNFPALGSATPKAMPFAGRRALPMRKLMGKPFKKFSGLLKNCHKVRIKASQKITVH